MSSEIYDLLDELAARGRRLRGQLPGDYKPAHENDPTAEVPERVYALIFSWPVWEEDTPVQGEAG